MKKFIKYQLAITGRNVNENVFKNWDWDNFNKLYPVELYGTEELCATLVDEPVFIGQILRNTARECNSIYQEFKAKLKADYCNKGNKITELFILKGDKLF